MTKKYIVKPEQAKILKELEKIVDRTIPQVKEFKWSTFGVKIEDGNVVGLGLYNRKLSTLPESITKLTSLQILSLEDNKLSTLPESIGNISSLKELKLGVNKLSTLPESIGNLSSLKRLDLNWNQLTTLPESIGNLSLLEKLQLDVNQLSALPESIGNLSLLEEIQLDNNQLSALPESIGNLSSLEKLYLMYNQLSTFPESITKLTLLEILNLSYNQLTTLPESIGNLSSLEELKLGVNKLSTLPESIGNLSSLKRLDLNWNQLTTLPESIGNLSLLEKLQLDVNQLSALPESITKLKLLQILYLNENQLLTLPKSLWKCKNLESLDLSDNPWEGEWRGIEKDTTPRVLELSRQRAPITVFIIHSRKDEEQYFVNALAQYLENCKEIREVRMNGGQEISEIQLLLFNATKNSITDDQCRHELKLAVTHDIPIIPIKGADITWEDLSQIDVEAGFNLSDKLGLKFDGKNVEQFCDELYEHIKKYKREVNLFELEERKIDEQWRNFKIICEKLIGSEKFREKFNENMEQFNNLSEKLRIKKISLVDYFFKWGQILNSEPD